MTDDIKIRVRRVAGSQRAWALATGQSEEHVSRVLAGKKDVPAWWWALIELLEVTPPKSLPPRWGGPEA